VKGQKAIDDCEKKNMSEIQISAIFTMAPMQKNLQIADYN
jgi:hypothetical protein